MKERRGPSNSLTCDGLDYQAGETQGRDTFVCTLIRLRSSACCGRKGGANREFLQRSCCWPRVESDEKLFLRGVCRRSSALALQTQGKPFVRIMDLQRWASALFECKTQWAHAECYSSDETIQKNNYAFKIQKINFAVPSKLIVCPLN